MAFDPSTTNWQDLETPIAQVALCSCGEKASPRVDCVRCGLPVAGAVDPAETAEALVAWMRECTRLRAALHNVSLVLRQPGDYPDTDLNDIRAIVDEALRTPEVPG
jgi:hypothetical protein